MNPDNQQFSHGQYDFITNPGQAPKQPLLGGSTKSRIFIFVGGLVLLLIIFMVVMSVLSSGKNSATDNLRSLVAEQEEIARIAKLGSENSLSSDVRGFAVSTEYSVKTSQQEVIALLQKNNVKLKDEELGTKTNPKTDKILEAAASSNRYDEAFMTTMKELISSYKKSLTTLYKSLESEESKSVLDKAYSSANNLVRDPSPEATPVPATN